MTLNHLFLALIACTLCGVSSMPTLLGQSSDASVAADQKPKQNSRNMAMDWSAPRKPTKDEYYKIMDL